MGLLSFDDIIGQDRVCRVLERIITSGRYPSFLFVGQPGVGKRTVAIKFAQAVNCGCDSNEHYKECPTCQAIASLTHPDVKLLFPMRKPRPDATPQDVAAAIIEHYPYYALHKPQPLSPPNYQLSIEMIRWLKIEMAKPPLRAAQRVFILLNVHQMKEDAQNALLKILEEPQINTTFILTTPTPSAVFDTIRSRCQIIRFSDIAETEIVSWLEKRMTFTETEIDDLQHRFSFAATLAHGSLGRAWRILNNTEEFIVQPLIEHITRLSDETSIIKAVEDLEEFPMPALIDTALLLYRQAIRTQIGLPALASFSRSIETLCSFSNLREKIRYLYDRLHQSQLNTNLPLSIYSLLSGCNYKNSDYQVSSSE